MHKIPFRLTLLLTLLLLSFVPQQKAINVKVNHPELPRTRPDDQIITHSGYTISYNQTYHIANWVAYQLTSEETIPEVKRNDHFIPDPLLQSGSASNSDYKGSGYDRGHLAPSADMCYSYQTMDESFYLSNMSPQTPSFNRGIWSKLEKQVRQWAIDDKAIYVVTGTILTKGLPTIGYNRISVPHYFYKVILDYAQPHSKGIGFILPNEGSQESLMHYALSIDEVEKATGIDFFYKLQDEQAEHKMDISAWSWTGTSSSHLKGKSASSVQCMGRTKAGARCKNRTLNANRYCHLHQSQISGIAAQNVPE